MMMRTEVRYGVLYRRFRDTARYWQLAVMLRKSCFVFVVLQFTGRPAVQATLLMLVFMLAQWGQLTFSPYREIVMPKSANRCCRSCRSRAKSAVSSTHADPTQKPSLLRRSIAFTKRVRTDPNVMETSTLLCSALIACSGAIYYAASESFKTDPAPPLAMAFIDVLCTTVIVLPTAYMIIALLVPLYAAATSILSRGTAQRDAQEAVKRMMHEAGFQQTNPMEEAQSRAARAAGEAEIEGAARAGAAAPPPARIASAVDARVRSLPGISKHARAVAQRSKRRIEVQMTTVQPASQQCD